MHGVSRSCTVACAPLFHYGFSRVKYRLIFIRPKDLNDTSSFDEDKLLEFYRGLFSDLSVDQEENQELAAFFTEENPPPKDQLVNVRASAFRIGCEYLTDEKASNVSLLRCINVVVDSFEECCLK